MNEDGLELSVMKQRLFDLVPPAGIAAVVLFWSLGPKGLIDNPWTVVVVGLLILAVVQVLEFVHERHSGWRLDTREFVTDLYYVILSNTAIAWATVALAETSLLAAKKALGIGTPWAMQLPFVAQVALVVFLIEFGQYWMHRLMHTNAFFWSTHAPHHHLTQLNAMKGAVGNPLELFLISLSVVALFDLPLAAVFCAINVLGVISTFAHANVKSNPPIWYAYFLTTIRNHSLHHTALSYEDTRCNYGNSLILLDRIFGTYREGESSVVGQDDRKRLTIVEQTLFPVQPLVDKIKARRTDSQPVAS
jgi:sterol desaturase/sphingolipid hydroxylase (fatty acid hydroxylase superfamily)